MITYLIFVRFLFLVSLRAGFCALHHFLVLSTCQIITVRAHLKSVQLIPCECSTLVRGLSEHFALTSSTFSFACNLEFHCPSEHHCMLPQAFQDDFRKALCATCGAQYPVELSSPPKGCLICLDERQYVPATGQKWTSIGELLDDGVHTTLEPIDLDERIVRVMNSPGVGISQTRENPFLCARCKALHSSIL